MDADKDIQQGLLPGRGEEEPEREFLNWRYEKTSIKRKLFRRFAVLQLVLIALYTIVVVVLLRKVSTSPAGNRRNEDFVYTPATSVDKFQKKELNMHLYKDNPFKGPPTPEVEAAWENLFTNAYIRLSKDELAKIGRNSTPIPDGSGDFIGALDVYHQLHCVHFIFQYVHQDYYTLAKINVPDTDHINHCIDVLRQVIMCFGDTSIGTMTFYDNYPKTWPEFKFEHSCRNWDAIDSWAGQPGRAVDQSDPERIRSWLHNPNFVNNGVYFDGHGEDDSD